MFLLVKFKMRDQYFENSFSCFAWIQCYECWLL